MKDRESLKEEDKQADSHLNWLRSIGFKIEYLIVGTWVKALGEGEQKPSGAFAYKTFANELRKGEGIGLLTLAKINGKGYEYKTLPFGEYPKISSFRLSFEDKLKQADDDILKHREASCKAFGFWENSLINGVSDYLIKKGVGSYSIKFRKNQYGKVAVVPMRDISGKLWNYQILNANGTKLFSKNGRIKGLFHCLAPLIDGKPIGLSEAYATGATCFELSGVPVVCAFSASNLLSVAKVIRLHYPKSRIIFFADNDRHLEKNIGVELATKAMKVLGSNCLLAIPDFGNIPKGKDASDWNDLVRLKGSDVAKAQISMLGIKSSDFICSVKMKRGDLPRPNEH